MFNYFWRDGWINFHSKSLKKWVKKMARGRMSLRVSHHLVKEDWKLSSIKKMGHDCVWSQNNSSCLGTDNGFCLDLKFLIWRPSSGRSFTQMCWLFSSLYYFRPGLVFNAWLKRHVPSRHKKTVLTVLEERIPRQTIAPILFSPGN